MTSKNMQSERAFQLKVLKDLRTLSKCWVLKSQERARHGTPDLLICLNGKFVAVELKKEDGKLAPIQKHALSRIEKANGLSFAAKPSTWSVQFEILRSLTE